MIPFVHVPSVELGPVELHPFGMLVAIAVLVGTSLAKRRARLLGIDEEKLRSFVTWMLAGGFIGGHVIDAILYHPRAVWADPWMLLFLWKSQGAFGGFIGATIGVVAWKLVATRPLRLREQPEAILPLADLVLSVFPVAWIFGRLGCAVAHDHPGMHARADAMFAVAYGPYDVFSVVHLPLGIELRWGNAPRWDLGTLEMLFAVILAASFATTWKNAMRPGWYVAATCMAYAPVRFAMDFLRIREGAGADARYLDLTPAQWACIPLFAFGAWLLLRGNRDRPLSPPRVVVGSRRRRESRGTLR